MKKLFYTQTQENTVAKGFQFNLIYEETLLSSRICYPETLKKPQKTVQYIYLVYMDSTSHEINLVYTNRKKKGKVQNHCGRLN